MVFEGTNVEGAVFREAAGRKCVVCFECTNVEELCVQLALGDSAERVFDGQTVVLTYRGRNGVIVSEGVSSGKTCWSLWVLAANSSAEDIFFVHAAQYVL